MDALEHARTNSEVIFIATLRVSTLLLFRDQRFPGYSILSFDPWDATSIDSLTEQDYIQFMTDLRAASGAIRTGLSPDHMNYELLDNTNPHLHWHIIPRYRTDPRWGQPIWEGYPRGEFNMNRHVVPDETYRQTVTRIRQHLP